MITQSQIQQVSDEIARRFHPKRIILFGSYAYGTPTEDSDVDLLVVMPLPSKGRGRASDIRMHLEVVFPLDLVVCDPDYLAQRIEINDFFLQPLRDYCERESALCRRLRSNGLIRRKGIGAAQTVRDKCRPERTMI